VTADRRGCRETGSMLLMLLGVVLATGGCSSLRPDGSAAATVASRFHDDVHHGHGRAACALLVPSTAKELEQSSGKACPTAVVSAQLPDGRAVRGADAYGHAARVLMDHDVVFLAVVGDRWQVRAAGCRGDGQETPYDCTVKGG
jgi:hypothetical protein